MKSLYSLLVGALFSVSISAMSAGEAAKIQAVSDEWRGTYKYDKETYDELQDSISVVTDTHALLERSNLEASLKEKLEDMQRKALQKIVNQADRFLPYALREFTLVIAARQKDLGSQSEEAKKLIGKNLRLKEQALEAFVISTGLAAIPHLSDLQGRALRKNSDFVAQRVKGILQSIVKREELQKESAKLVGESPTDTPSTSVTNSASPSANTTLSTRPGSSAANPIRAEQPAADLPTRPSIQSSTN